MKRLISFFVFSLSLPLWSASQSVLEANVKGNKIKLIQVDEELVIESSEINTSVKKEKCSRSSIENLKKEIQKISDKSLSYQGKDAFKITILGKPRSVTSESPLARYSKNFAQHMITFKNQVNLSCKRK